LYVREGYKTEVSVFTVFEAAMKSDVKSFEDLVKIFVQV
jgi:hypothetical protein